MAKVFLRNPIQRPKETLRSGTANPKDSGSTRERHWHYLYTTLITAIICMVAVISMPSIASAAIASGTSGTCTWEIDDAGTLTIRPTNGTNGTLNNYTGVSPEWYSNRSSIKKVYVAPGVKANTGTFNLFAELSNCTEMDVHNLDVSGTSNMGNMFKNCTALPSLDVSNWDTGNVTDMSYMFNKCKVLTSLNVGNWDTGNVTKMGSMFSVCNALTSLDVSNWDAGNVTNMDGMFYNCNALAEIILGDDFSFKGNNISTTSDQAVLPTPPTATTTGKWIKEDKTAGPLTPEQLRNQYDANASAWSGKWVWEVKNDSVVLNFDANGGYTDQSRITQNAPFTAVTMPRASRPGYYLISWNTKPDGSGDSYPAGSSYTPSGGELKTFYAQWDTAASYRVNIYQQRMDFSGYDLVKTETRYARPGAAEEVIPDEYNGFMTPAPQTKTIAADNSTVADFYYDRGHFTVSFNGNGADSGSMPDQTIATGMVQRLSDNTYKYTDHFFMGWNTKADGTGTSYGDAQAVSDLAGHNESITLYAQWLDLSGGTYSPTDGKYIFHLRAGETATIPNLPAGTEYSIREIDNPNGWSQTGAVDDSGVIGANETSRGKITNTYAASGSVSLMAYKTMETGELVPGAFTFELKKNGTLIESATNGTIDEAEEILNPATETTAKNPYYGMSIVRFSDIEFNEPGDYTYTITERNGGEADIRYDSHTETVVIHVSDNHDGTLSCVPEYDQDGPVFRNSKVPVFDESRKGDLQISKTVENATSDRTFDFTLSLTDENGLELSDYYTADIVKTAGKDTYVTGGRETVSAVSHTQNVDDLGEKQSNYGNNWNNNNIRGTGREAGDSKAHVITIPGAESLHVSIVFGGESANYDYVAMWQGAHENYTAQTNYGTSVTGRLGGGNHDAASNLAEYDVPGDTVTFSYRSDSSQCGDGYGYYAVVTGEVDSTEYSNDYIESEMVTNGSVIHLSNGQTAVIRNLPEGVHYKVTEEEVPGYETITAGDRGVIADGSAAEASFRNVYSALGSVQIEADKTFTGGDISANTFQFQLLDADGNVVSTGENDSEGHIVFTPIDYETKDSGKRYRYSMVEVPGDNEDVIYDTHTEDVTVTVMDDGAGHLSGVPVYSGSASFTNTVSQKQEMFISKRDAGGEEIAGAELTVTGRENGAAEDITPIRWTSGSDGTIPGGTALKPHEVQLRPGTYVLHEESAPDGYVVAADIQFTLASDGTITTKRKSGSSWESSDDADGNTVIMTDVTEEMGVLISKQNINGDEIAGATLRITGRANGASSDIAPIQWTSGSDGTVAGGTALKPHAVSLKPGTYVLHEESAPNGYVVATDIQFVLGEDGSITTSRWNGSSWTASSDANGNTVVMTDDFDTTDVVISKQDINGAEIPGASMKITGRADSESADITPIEWTSGSDGTVTGGTALKPHTVSLKPGTYILHEEGAPEGYVVASDIKFVIGSDNAITTYRKNGSNEWVVSTDASGNVITMTDEYKLQKLSVSKTVTGSMGSRDKKFTFKLRLTRDGSSVAQTFTVTGLPDTASITTDAHGEAEIRLSHGDTAVISGIRYGTAYTVTENDYRNEGYTTSSTNASGTLDADKTAAFTNSHNMSVPTSSDTNTRALGAAAAAGAAALLAGVVVRRRKKRAKNKE